MQNSKLTIRGQKEKGNNLRNLGIIGKAISKTLVRNYIGK